MPPAIHFPKPSAATLRSPEEDEMYLDPSDCWDHYCSRRGGCPDPPCRCSVLDRMTGEDGSAGHGFQPCHYQPLLKWKRDGSLANHPAKNLKHPDPSLCL